ncbi:MAG: lipoyl(octanoyl) transferase LipB [Candidatus Caldarchaeum sp.]|nr:lipoyl(octanoyl) transferase LipB [Candidatus Caldarchaeum sp.]MDW7977178.1 lipoyl(octanoyl) transferase LipB [Candidatus Caldarchaeum sp.]MDW8359592.1 lipoyl(octanoyl) transferase LipB [Candidatus Caldarchaeum sp.]
MSSDRIDFIDLGLSDYLDTHRLMLKLVDRRVAGKIPDTVLLLEHPDVYTLGRRGLEENVLDKSIPLYRVERGGDATYHGPGQLVVYPIISLAENKLGVADLVKTLEESVIRVLAEYGVKASRVDGKPGVWVDGRKIASIGLALKNWVSYHGLAFNVNTDLEKFKGIKPCGMDSDVMTSLHIIKGHRIELAGVKKLFAETLASLLKKQYLVKAGADNGI